MKNIKKLIIFLLFVMVISMLPQASLGLSVTTPTSNTTGSKYFSAYPGVYEMGDGYAVIWATSFNGTGYIEYTYGGVKHRVYDERNGIVRTNDTIHVVKVPYEHLQGNSYTVYSQEVTSHSYANTNYGTTISAGPITLKKYDGGKDFDILVLTDTHNKLDWTKSIAAQFSGDPDLVIFSGDIADKLVTKGDIEHMFNIMGTTSGGRYPLVYSRGNHEIRDVASTMLKEYFPTKTGEFYFDFTYGPLWAVVMDTGEDKDDNHEYYGNLANYTEYLHQQEAWLRSLRMNENATYRLSINHIPEIMNLPNGVDYSDSIKHLGFQFAVSGHKHWSQLYSIGRTDYSSKINHETLLCGGYAANIASWVNFNGDYAYITTKRGNNVTSTNTNSAEASKYVDFNNYPVKLCSYVGSVPAAMDNMEYGTHNLFNPSYASSGSITMSVYPTVFETGGDWYNVVWATNTTDSNAKGSTGYVEYVYNGTTYQQYEEVGGYRRVCNNIHTVKVPKEHLNNNTYRVGSFIMNYATTSSGARYYTAGDYMESETILFESKTGDKAVNLLVCPDIKTNNGDTKGAANAAWQSMNAISTSPTYVVVNGDAVEVALYSENDLAALFTATANVSKGGSYPVIFSRGNSECRGSYATELIEYIPTVTGEFYYSLDVGDYTFVNLDTAEDDPDSNSKYNGRIFLDDVREDQLNWINNLPAGDIISISHIPFGTVNNRFGLDFQTAIRAKGGLLSIAGHNSTYSLSTTVNSNNICTLVPSGFNSSNTTNACSAVLLSEHYAHIRTVQSNSNGSSITTVAEKTLDLNTGATPSYSAAKPPLSNNVYTVSTPGHMKWISTNCTSTDSFSGYTFQLAGDIDMQLVPFTPIGGNDSNALDSNATSAAFSGIFDGNGYQIKNLNIISSKHNVGLFGFVRQGTVKNLTLSGGMVQGTSFVGGIVGNTYNKSTVQDCYNNLIVHSLAGSKIGGISGFLGGASTINRCANFGSVGGCRTTGYVGGIVGQIAGASTNYITNCYNRGNVSGQKYAGGVFGYTGATLTVQNCYNAAPVTSPGSQGAIATSTSGSKVSVSNTYYSTGFNGAAAATASGNSLGTKKDASYMKSSSFANTLSSSDFSYYQNLNDGYPVHKNNPHAPGASGHTYQATVTAPTCSTAGYTTYLCGCGDKYTETIPALGHTEKTLSAVAATCTTPGKTEGKQCTVCGVITVPQGTVDAKEHTEITIPGKDATCTATGLTEGKKCTVCGEITVEQNDIPAKGHAEETLEAVAPTCTATGLTAGKKCSVCGVTTVAQETVLAKGHTEVIDAAVEATCTATGLTEGKHCSVCNKVLVAQTTVDAKGHTEKTLAAVAATCTQSGKTEGKKCTVCGEVTVKQTTVPAKGHTEVTLEAVAPTCTETGLTAGKKCSVCGTTTVEQKVVDALGHIEVIDAAIAPTCTATGLTEGKHCSVCNEVIVKQTTVDAKGHDEKTLAAVAPTCTATGLTAGKKCSVCGTTTVEQKVVDALGHTEVIDAAVAPTCTATGLTEGKHCSVCNEVIVKQTTVDAKGHTEKTLAAVAATCTQSGKTEGKKCTVCGEVTVKQTTIPALGHTEETLEAVAPTCTATGLTAGKKCTVCGVTTKAQETVPAKGHTEKTLEAVAATCTTAGKTEGKQCTVCGVTTKAQETVPAKGHSFTTTRGSQVSSATCVSPAVYKVKCDNCSVQSDTKTMTYGSVNTYNHAGSLVYSNITETGHIGTYNCCGTTSTSKTHSYYANDGQCDCGQWAAAVVTGNGRVNYFNTLIEAEADIYSVSYGSPVIKLLRDVDLGSDGLYIKGGKDYDDYSISFTLNLNGKTLSSDGVTIHHGIQGTTKSGRVGLIITDTSMEGTGKIISRNGNAISWTCSGANYTTYGNFYSAMEIKGGTIGDMYIAHGGTVTVKGGTVGNVTISGTNRDYYQTEFVVTKGTVKSVNVNGKSDTKLTVNGGTITDGITSTCGRAYVYGGTVSGVTANGGTVLLYGGTIQGSPYDVVVKSGAVLLNVDYNKYNGTTFPGGITVSGSTLNDLLSFPCVYTVDGKIYNPADTQTSIGKDTSIVRPYLVTWRADGKDVYTEKVLANGNATVTPEVPAKEGYSGTWSANAPTNVTANVMINAVYTPKTYTVQWLNGDTVYLEETYEYGATITAPAVNPEKATSGCTVYTFAGWNGWTEGMKMPANEVLVFTANYTDETIHSWNDATCTAPKTCGNCGATEGEALGHTEVIDKAVEATCTTDGKTEGKHCSVCDIVLTAQETIPANGHTEVIDAAVDATCTATGLTEGKHCSVCDKVLVAQTVVDALGHTNETIPGTAADCENTGLTDGVKCSVCGEILTEQETIPAKGHTEVTIPGTAADCENTGLTAGKKCSVCGVTTVAQETIPANGHTEVIDAAVDATCTATGLTEGKHCSVCDKVLVAQTVVDALGHTNETIPGTAADCENTGLTDGVKCSACGEILTEQETIPALGHNYENGLCTNCGKTDPTPVVSDKVEGLHATDVTPFTFTVEWSPLQGAKKYWVYINGYLYRSSLEPSLTVLKRTPENTYNVSVIALMEDGKILPLDEANVISITAKPYVWSYAKTDTTVTLTWDVVGCTKTWIYYGTSPDNLTLYTSTTGSSYTMINLQPSTAYYFQLSHLINGTVSTTVKHMTTVTRPSATVTPKVEGLTAVDVTADTITVSWNALAGATKYWVYVDGKSYSGTTGTTLTIKRLNPDTDYTIAVNALHNGKILSIADAKTITVHTTQ